jgi:hypothetical protein
LFSFQFSNGFQIENSVGENCTPFPDIQGAGLPPHYSNWKNGLKAPFSNAKKCQK